MVQLGETVRDVVSGFTGMAVRKVTYVNGCIQFEVQPKVAEAGKMPESQYFDHQRLESVAGEVLTAIEPGLFVGKLGFPMVHRITGYKGVSVGLAISWSGRMRYGLRSKVGEDGKLTDTEWFDEEELEVEGEPMKMASSDTGADVHPDAPQRG
jgi:hypothetical protein